MMDVNLRNKKLVAVGIHVLGWLLLFSFPLYTHMGLPFSLDVPWQITFKNNIHFFLLIVLFYVNYLFLIPKFLFRKKFVYYFHSVLSILVFFVIADGMLNNALNVDRVAVKWRFGISESGQISSDVPPPLPPPPESEGRDDSLAVNWFADSNQRFGTYFRQDSLRNSSRLSGVVMRRRVLFDLFPALSAIFILLLGTGVKFGQQWFKNERQKEEIEKEKLQTELSFLKSQINPHFFFNMLNNIYSLVRSDPPRAQRSIHKLSKLMRYVLYESAREYVTLEMEIAFIKNYIDLAKIRLSDGTDISFEQHTEDVELLIPPLLFVPFLENIFKHGVRQNESSNIVISLTQTENAIYFYSQNNIFNNSSFKSKPGIGLKNARRRLDLLYKENYSLDIIEVLSGDVKQFKVHLKVPLHEA